MDIDEKAGRDTTPRVGASDGTSNSEAPSVGASGGEATGRWATGWYMRKRHIVNEERTTSAICSDYTGLYPDGRESGAKWNVPIPPADSAEVMALPPCGLCTRKVKR